MTLFKLDLPKAYEQDYLSLVKEGLIRRIQEGVTKAGQKCVFSDEVKEILLPHWNSSTPDEKRVERLLIAEPRELKQLNDDITIEIGQLPKDKHPKEGDIETIFDYSGIFDSSSKNKAYELALHIGAATCCYCNRQYTFTVVTNQNKNKDDRLTRPAFDHWFPKSRYPLMSISLYNLIPSCTICNSSAKGDHDVNLNDYIHPYVHLPGRPKIKFVADVATDSDYSWTIKIEREANSPEDNTVRMFYLDELYKKHDLLELKDIMDFKTKYPDNFLKTLMDFMEESKLKAEELTQEDVYRMMFGIEMNEERQLERPFGKMKFDILKELLE